jgi:hypothetical protein
MERLDGETILINFDSGEYFSFRGSSADILWLIDAGVDRQHWISVLRDAFENSPIGGEIVAEIDSFLTELADAGVIEPSVSSGGPPASLPNDYARVAWTPPSVHANDDLADLLLIDPIHDTGEDGWPKTRPS